MEDKRLEVGSVVYHRLVGDVIVTKWLLAGGFVQVGDSGFYLEDCSTSISRLSRLKNADKDNIC